ncbi:MAG: glycosyl hydrolase family 28-related protein, partial [Phycisphaerae bacterium]
MTKLSRRSWMGMATAASLAMVDHCAHAATASASDTVGGETPFARNVLEFGAKGDGKKDNTAAFQKALDAAHAAGGGSVHVPAGKYLFKGHLELPSATALVGSYAGPPSGFFGQLGNGTVLLPTEGRGKPEGTAFISARGVSST